MGAREGTRVSHGTTSTATGPISRVTGAVTRDHDGADMNRPRDERTHVAYLILADAVQNVDGKLEMTGGDWDTLFVRDIGRPAAFSFACGVRVPWAEADAQHRLTLSVVGADGRPIAPPHEETFRVGRSRLTGPQAVAHLPFAVRWDLTFPTYGRYVLTAAVDARAEDARRVAFSVRPAADSEPAISEAEMNIIDEELGQLD